MVLQFFVVNNHEHTIWVFRNGVVQTFKLHVVKLLNEYLKMVANDKWVLVAVLRKQFLIGFAISYLLSHVYIWSHDIHLFDRSRWKHASNAVLWDQVCMISVDCCRVFDSMNRNKLKLFWTLELSCVKKNKSNAI